MGNFHCIPESCARVIWREYPDEDWVYVDGDDYSLEQKKGRDENVFYDVTFRYWQTKIPECYKIRENEATYRIKGAITGIGKQYIGNKTSKSYSCYEVAPQQIEFGHLYLGSTSGNQYILYNVGFWSDHVSKPDLTDGEIISIVRVDGEPDTSGNCTLTITKNGEVVHEVTRDVCPEVEKLPCHLGEPQEIQIEKTPFLERIEVVDYAYDVRWGGLVDSDNFGFLLAKKQIPNECLNIYQNSVGSTIPNDFFQIANTPENGYNQVQQICSAVDCPPPEYEVICNCDEGCPPGTCEVICGSHLCCYDSTGNPVKEIPISDYFPSNTRGAGS